MELARLGQPGQIAALVTGANTGLGQAIAIALAEAGADIVGGRTYYVHGAVIPVDGGWLAR